MVCVCSMETRAVKSEIVSSWTRVWSASTRSWLWTLNTSDIHRTWSLSLDSMSTSTKMVSSLPVRQGVEVDCDDRVGGKAVRWQMKKSQHAASAIYCEIPWERVPYLSALDVRSRQGTIQIHVYLYLYLYLTDNVIIIIIERRDFRGILSDDCKDTLQTQNKTVQVWRTRTSKVSIRYRWRQSCRNQESFRRTVPSPADAWKTPVKMTMWEVWANCSMSVPWQRGRYDCRQ